MIQKCLWFLLDRTQEGLGWGKLSAFHCCDKSPEKNHLNKKGLLLAHSHRGMGTWSLGSRVSGPEAMQNIMVWSAWWSKAGQEAKTERACFSNKTPSPKSIMAWINQWLNLSMMPQSLHDPITSQSLTLNTAALEAKPSTHKLLWDTPNHNRRVSHPTLYEGTACLGDNERPPEEPTYTHFLKEARSRGQQQQWKESENERIWIWLWPLKDLQGFAPNVSVYPQGGVEWTHCRFCCKRAADGAKRDPHPWLPTRQSSV